MRKITYRGIFTGLILLVCHSCMKTDEYPVEPSIELESFTRIYNSSQGIFDRGILRISFTDGDGDIGLGPDETEPPFDYNFIITYFEIQNGDTVEELLVWYNKQTQEFDTINHNARIPYLTAKGTSKAINGVIEDTLQIYNYNSEFDTILFRAYILDRALHKSNEVITPLIIRE